MKNIPVFFLAYNRLEYTKQSLKALCKTTYPITIYIHDNGSTDGTKEWLKNFILNQDWKMNINIEGIHFESSETNGGINKPLNQFLRRYRDYEYIAKIDNDTVVEPEWLDKLTQVMEVKQEIDALGAYMQRPPGMTFKAWVDSDFMRKVSLGSDTLAYCAYAGGTGVLIRMRMFKEMGLPYERVNSRQGDLTLMFRLRSNNGQNNNIAWYSGTTVKLLNIKEDGVSLDETYSDYDAELKSYRDEGNEWYIKMGGPKGIQTWIDHNGGRERI